MLIEEIKNIRATRSELRRFGISVGIVLGILSCILFLRKSDIYPVFIALSIVFLFLGCVVPILLKPIYKLWMSLAIIITTLLTRIILILLFYLVVTPVGILARLFGKHFLDLGFKRDTDSYWIERKKTQLARDDYERQF